MRPTTYTCVGKSTHSGMVCVYRVLAEISFSSRRFHLGIMLFGRERVGDSMHMVLAAYLTTAFVVGGVGAWLLLRSPDSRGAAIMFSMAMWMALIVTPIQIMAGDAHGLNTLEHQHAKIAAMEGHYESFPEGRAPLILLGVPDGDTGET